MLVCDYIVERIDGDYAMLKRTNLPEEEAKMVARALLPEEIRTWSAPPPPSWGHLPNGPRIVPADCRDLLLVVERVELRQLHGLGL